MDPIIYFSQTIYSSFTCSSSFEFIVNSQTQAASFFSWDSSSVISNSRESLNNNTLIGPSLNSSFGNIQFPQNFNLIPEFKIANIFQNHFASSYYLILSIIFYFAVYFLMSTISNLPLLSTITAFVFVIITLPFFGIPIISDIYWWQFSYYNTGMYVTCIFFTVYIKLLAQYTKKTA